MPMHWFFSYTRHAPPPCFATGKQLLETMQSSKYNWVVSGGRLPTCNTIFVDSGVLAVGTHYPTDIARNLHDCDAGIVFLTPPDFRMQPPRADQASGSPEQDAAEDADADAVFIWKHHHWLFREADTLVDRYLAGHIQACVPIYVGTTEEKHPIARKSFRYVKGLLNLEITPGETRLEEYEKIIDQLQKISQISKKSSRNNNDKLIDVTILLLINKFISKISNENFRGTKIKAVSVLLRPTLRSEPPDIRKESVAKYIHCFGAYKHLPPPELDRVDDKSLDHAVAYLISDSAQRFHGATQADKDDYLWTLRRLNYAFHTTLKEEAERGSFDLDCQQQRRVCRTLWVTANQKMAIVEGLKQPVEHFLLIYDKPNVPDDAKARMLKDALFEIVQASAELAETREDGNLDGCCPADIKAVLEPPADKRLTNKPSVNMNTHFCRIESHWTEMTSLNDMAQVERRIAEVLPIAAGKSFPTVYVDYKGLLLEKDEVAEMCNLDRLKRRLSGIHVKNHRRPMYSFTFADREQLREHQVNIRDYIPIELDLAWRTEVGNRILIEDDANFEESF